MARKNSWAASCELRHDVRRLRGNAAPGQLKN